MYGLILENVANYVRTHHGPQVWQEVQYVAGLDDATFDAHDSFSEGLANRIVWATQDVTGYELDTIMKEIGMDFYTFLSKYEYDKILRVLGRTLTEFLNGLDNLHEYLRFSYPLLKPPSFSCEHESRTGLTLHYRSKRHGFVSYVMGQVTNIGKLLFDTDVEIEILDQETDENMNQHVIMRLHFNNVEFQATKTQEVDEDLVHSIVQINSETLFDIFPFIIVFNRGMRIRNVGLGLMRIMPKLIGKRVNTEFVMMRPLVSFRWEEIMLHANNQFEIMSVDPVFMDGKIYFVAGDVKEVEQERRRMAIEDKMKFLTLKGQMMYMQEWESICFLGIPLMENLEQMYKTGLFINDFALHDSSRDLVLASTQEKAEIKLLLDQEQHKKDRLNESMAKLDAERERSDQILYQLLPRSVAEKLRSGLDPLSTCESFDSVTVLFTDIVGFTTICSGLEPIAVVGLLNMMYSSFDALTEKHSVFKVNSICVCGQRAVAICTHRFNVESIKQCGNVQHVNVISASGVCIDDFRKVVPSISTVHLVNSHRLCTCLKDCHIESQMVHYKQKEVNFLSPSVKHGKEWKNWEIGLLASSVTIVTGCCVWLAYKYRSRLPLCGNSTSESEAPIYRSCSERSGISSRSSSRRSRPRHHTDRRQTHTRAHGAFPTPPIPSNAFINMERSEPL